MRTSVVKYGIVGLISSIALEIAAWQLNNPPLMFMSVALFIICLITLGCVVTDLVNGQT